MSYSNWTLCRPITPTPTTLTSSSISAHTLYPSSSPSEPQAHHREEYYERLLGPAEVGFYWDSVYRGTADSLQNAIVEELKSSANDRSKLQTEANVRAAWIALKRMHPLLGSRIEERPSSSLSFSDTHTSEPMSEDVEIYFTINPSHLSMCVHPHEVIFTSCGSEDEASELAEQVINGRPQQESSSADSLLPWSSFPSGRILSNDLPACLIFVHRRDKPGTFHVMTHVAHLITDGMANSTILTTFLDLLCEVGRKDSSLGTLDRVKPLEELLKLCVASEALFPSVKHSRAKQRWHRVLGHVLLGIRNAKMMGGHTLPRKMTTMTYHRPARSSTISSSFTIPQTALILSTCRKLNITFGNAYPILGQLALTRVLYRQFLQGLISQDEWEFRRRQPMLTGGPSNLRPYLDSEWLKNGGEEVVCLSIGFFFYTLPFMPLGSASSRTRDEVPPFGDLLTKERFLLRCSSIKQQADAIFRHPRALDIGAARMPGRIERSRALALKYRELQREQKADETEVKIPEHGEAISVIQEPEVLGPVMAHGGSSFGNADLLVPLAYPRNRGASSSPTPVLKLIKTTTRLRCRPTELYLGAATSRKQMHLTVYWDENVYDRETVCDWLAEVREATLYYLGGGGGGVERVFEKVGEVEAYAKL